MRRLVVRSAGSSTSGTPATQVAQIAAATGTKLVEWHCKIGQTSTANTQVRMIVTYTDDTTTTVDTVAATATYAVVNAGGYLRISGATPDALTTFSAKDIKTIRVETLGSGTGTRYATIGAVQVTATDTKRAAGTSTSGTPGTAVASITADSGKVFTGWTVLSSQNAGLNTQHRLTITYADTTTTTVDTVANTSGNLRGNDGGVIRVAVSSGDQVTALSAKEITGISVATLGTGTSTRYAVVAGEQAAVGVSSILRSSGSSASGTAGTQVAEVAAASGKYIAAWTAFAAQTTTASTNLDVVTTYEDNTTTTITTGANSGQQIGANAGGAVRLSGSAGAEVNTHNTKRIKKIRIQTAGTGVGTRYGTISAQEETPSRLPQVGVG